MRPYEDNTSRNVAVLVAVIVLIVIGLVALGASFFGVEQGERGLKLNGGRLSETIVEPGWHLKVPFYQSVVKMDVRVQKEQISAGAASSDLQTVNAVVALNYNLNPTMVKKVYSELKQDYKERLIAPTMQEAVKASIAKFTAEEVITKREAVSQSIKMTLKERLEPRGIEVGDFNIVNFEFSKSFDEAIERKVTAEQNALAAKNQLEQIKYEAQQQIEQAKGKAEAMNIEATALRDNPQLLELRSIEKWNGNLPTYMGSGTVP